MLRGQSGILGESTEEPTVRPGALMTSVVAAHAVRRKGEDGLRVERRLIGGDVVLCAVIVDGHSGHQAASFVVDHIIEFICEESRDDANVSAFSQALERAFLRLNVLLCREDSQHTSGTTATVCLINETRGELTTGHVGNSAAILLPESPAAERLLSVPLTGEHRLAESEDERTRVLALGAKLGYAITDGQPSGPLRAYPGGVTCARALGDRDRAPFVSPMPDITVMPFPEGNACVLIASDGVWDAIPHKKVIKTVLKARDVREAAEKIVSKALRAKGLHDDITCVCIVGGRNRSELDAVAEEQGEVQGFSHLPAGARYLHRPHAQRPGHHLRHDHRGAAPSSPDMIADALRRALETAGSLSDCSSTAATSSSSASSSSASSSSAVTSPRQAFCDSPKSEASASAGTALAMLRPVALLTIAVKQPMMPTSSTSPKASTSNASDERSRCLSAEAPQSSNPNPNPPPPSPLPPSPSPPFRPPPLHVQPVQPPPSSPPPPDRSRYSLLRMVRMAWNTPLWKHPPPSAAVLTSITIAEDLIARCVACTTEHRGTLMLGGGLNTRR